MRWSSASRKQRLPGGLDYRSPEANRSMAAGYARLDNEMFYMDKTMTVFGDPKEVVEEMVMAVEG